MHIKSIRIKKKKKKKEKKTLMAQYGSKLDLTGGK